MKLMKTEDAVGQVLCHDITQIIKGVTKDAVFRKGHIITEEDIPVLLSVGKDNITSGKRTIQCCMKMRRHRFFTICVKTITCIRPMSKKEKLN